MSSMRDPVRDALLGQAPNPQELPAYRESVRQIVAEQEKRLRRERFLATFAWIFCAALATLWVWATPRAGSGREPFLACIFMIVGAVEILKYRMHSLRVSLLAELKQLQVQLFDLQQRIDRQK